MRRPKTAGDAFYLQGWTRAAVTVNALLDADLTPFPGARAAVRCMRTEAWEREQAEKQAVAHLSVPWPIKAIIARGECEAYAVALGDA